MKVLGARAGRLVVDDGASNLTTNGLAALDFHSVRDEFRQLNHRLREQIMENDGPRSEVLEQLFAGVDLISRSDAGRTFKAFWNLLLDSERSMDLDQALDDVQ